MLGLTRTAALENAQQGIRVNSVAPGTIETPMIEDFAASSDDDVMASIREAHPTERVGEADEVSGATLYLASDAASFTTGASISVDGGYISR
nr:SDR family oxidoreductase [Curtobacterium sp. MCBD17_028]